MKYIRGFMMAWGMFCWIPCPYRQWRTEDRDAQIGMLPLLGAFLGAAVCFVWWLLDLAGADPLLAGAVITGVYFLMTGFIHLDGFMDCSDAVMPRHPEMEERQRILKDSCTGAFGAICLGLMLLIVFASWTSMVRHGADAEAKSVQPALWAAAVMIFTFSRTVSAVCVLKCTPMQTSQYAGAGDRKTGGAAAAALITGAVFAGLAMGLAAPGDSRVMISAAAAGGVTVMIAVLTGMFDRRKLGGMNGDISGHMITVSEMCGLMTLALTI